jgi:pyruvate kinase
MVSMPLGPFAGAGRSRRAWRPSRSAPPPGSVHLEVAALRRTKIVATVGPSSESAEVLSALVDAGLNVVRLNLSHGTPDELRRRLDTLLDLRRRLATPFGIMLDTRGPEVRIGHFGGEGSSPDAVELIEGRAFRLLPRPEALAPDERLGDADGVAVGWWRLAAPLPPGQPVLLDDGNIVLRVEEASTAEVVCRVEAGGVLPGGKKVNLPGIDLDLPVLLPEDHDDLRAGLAAGADFVAASFVNRATDVLEVRRFLESTGSRARLIAKIETVHGVKRFEEILRASDGIMVARGDLGVELPVQEVPLLQKQMIRSCNEAGKPVITATQMLESMVQHASPTRAEASDVANAIFDGSDAVMLSAETAVGAHPVQAVRVMSQIAQRTEEALPYREWLARGAAHHATVTDAIAYATVTAAQNLGAAAIVTATESGHTARTVAKYRPHAPILAMTPDPRVLTSLTLVWGVHPFPVPKSEVTDEMIDTAVRRGLESGAIGHGDLVVITAGIPVGIPGTTNMLKVHIVGDVLVRGTGIGQRVASGRAVVVGQRGARAEHFRRGDVLVAIETDSSLISLMERAGAVVTEEGGLTSHAAVVALSLGIPVVVGAVGATRILQDGAMVTVDGGRGLVYRGRVQLPSDTGDHSR